MSLIPNSIPLIQWGPRPGGLRFHQIAHVLGGHLGVSGPAGDGVRGGEHGQMVMAGQLPDLLDRPDRARVAVLDVAGEHVLGRTHPAHRVEKPVGDRGRSARTTPNTVHLPSSN